MATSSNFRPSRPASFVVRRVAGKSSPSHFRPVKTAVRGCEPVQMTAQEAEVFFAACETPMLAEPAIFEHLSEVSQWFKD